MQDSDDFRPSLGLIGFGAFGRLTARHLQRYFRIFAYDPVLRPGEDLGDVVAVDLAEAARCSIVVLAMPVNRIEESCLAIAPHLHGGALVLDVGSVKSIPADIMRRCLPDSVDIVATHPLFGPQSARDGIAGLTVAVCPIRGARGRRVAAFLRNALDLNVVVTTPEAHDREAAMVQGLTHLIAKVLVQMEPLPSRMTTPSFNLIMRAVDMVRDDAPEVFQAIEKSNPYSLEVRRRFFDLAAQLDGELGDPRPSASS